MTNSTKKRVSVLLALALLLSLATGCVSSFATPSQSAAPPAQSGGGSGSAPPAAGGGPVSLEVWYAVTGVSGETFAAQSEAYAARQENVTLNLSYSGGSGDTATKVSAALLTGTQPDVALMYAGPLYTGGRGDYAMGGLMDSPEFNKADVYEGMLDYCTYMDGGVCAVPYGISTQVMFYNQDLLAAAGVDMTNPPKTWDEFYEVCRQVRDSNKGVTAFDTTDQAWTLKSMFMQNGCPVVEKQDGAIVPVFNNEKGLEVADFWKSLVDEGIMPAGEHDNAENKFLAGGLAFVAASSIRVARWTGNTDFELGAIEMPYFTQPSLALGGNVLVILTSDPQRAAAAWDYISYLTSTEVDAEFALSTGYLPIRKSAMDLPGIQRRMEENPMYRVAFKQLDYTWSYTHFEQMGTMDMLLRNMLDNLEKNTGSAQALLDAAAKELSDEIALG